MAQLKVKISAVGSKPLAIIVESEDSPVWQWNTPGLQYQRAFENKVVSKRKRPQAHPNESMSTPQEPAHSNLNIPASPREFACNGET